MSDVDACCRSCFASIRLAKGLQCKVCGQAVGVADASCCAACLRTPALQTSTQSLFLYEGAVRQALLDWKYRHRDAALQWLLARAEAYLCTQIQADDVLLPVPTHLSQARRRGRHHTADLAYAIASTTAAQVCWQGLQIQAGYRPQHVLSAKQRRDNLRKAFSLCLPLPNYRRLYVCDDILTTGTTTARCVQVLAKKYTNIHVLTLAYAPLKS